MNSLDKRRYITIFFAKYDVAKVFYTILFVSYLALFDISFIKDNFFLSEIAIGLGLLAFILVSRRILREFVPIYYSRVSLIYLLVGLLSGSILLSSLIISRTQPGFGSICVLLSNTGIALLLLRGYLYSWGGYIVFYGLSAYFIRNILAGVSPDAVRVAGSFNGISIIMLQNCIPLCLALSMENKKIDLKPAIFTLVISTWGIGSSGVISSCILFLGLFFIHLKTNKKHIIPSVLIILPLFYLFLNKLITFAVNYINIEETFNYLVVKDVSVTERQDILFHYFNNLDLFSMIFGTDVFQDGFMSFYSYNYHNSYIALHSQTGFIGIIILALLCFSLLKYFRTNLIFFFLLLSIMLRISTDVGNFFTLADFILYFFIFDVITSDKAKILKYVNRVTVYGGT